jgi:hypothetical protein
MAQPDQAIEDVSQKPPADAGSRYISRPGVVTLICILTFIGGGWQGIQLAFFATGQFQPNSIQYLGTVVVLTLLTGMPLVIGIGMWHARNWARMLFVIFVPLMRLLDLVVLPHFSTVIALVVVLVLAVLLFRPHVSAYFSGLPSPAVDPASGLSGGPREIVHCPSCGKEIYSTVATCHHCGAAAQSGTTA